MGSASKRRSPSGGSCRPRLALVDLNAGLPNRSVGILAALIAEAGGRSERFDPRVEGRVPGAGFDAVLITGGPGAPRPDAPWVRRLRSAIPGWCARGPVMGICMGFHVMALAHGWGVRRLRADRVGAFPLIRTGAGRADPLTQRLPDDAMVFEQRSWGLVGRGWGVPLAIAPSGAPIALRFGPGCVATAFHPEASPGQVAAWARQDPVGQSIPDIAGQLPRLAHAASLVLPGWLRAVGLCPHPPLETR